MQTQILENVALLNFPLAIKNNFSIKHRIIFGIFWVFSIISIIALLIFYISQINSETAERYAIQKYMTLTEKLTKENNALEADFINANSLNNISSLVGSLNFEKAEKISYIRVLNNQVVSK